MTASIRWRENTPRSQMWSVMSPRSKRTPTNGPFVSAGQVVHGHDGVATARGNLRDVTADITGGAGKENIHCRRMRVSTR